MKLTLCDTNPDVVRSWLRHFGGVKDVDVVQGDILALEGGAIVSPANSFGWMDGGIDLAYRNHFGADIEARLQQRIRTTFRGEMPVGTSTVIGTDNERIPFMIAAPTMRLPMNVALTPNAYLAFRAALLVAVQLKREPLLCPGLATGCGGMPAERSAIQMRAAYDRVLGGANPDPIAEHRAMFAA